ncbi:MAG TPA: glycosyltransferase [Candidatus Angelobacter sp.]|nr:glycosyltransferase [Candidatus Angelobacter sp.]
MPSLTGGGAERVFSILLRYLDREVFEPHLGLLETEGVYLEDIPQDVVLHGLNISRARYALPSIVRLIWKVRPHSVLSTLGHLNLVLGMAKPFLPRSARLIVREAAVASRSLEDEVKHPRLWTWLYKRLYKRADKVLCLTDSMVDDMVDHFAIPREKLVRIYNPVEIERVRELGGLEENPYSGPGPHLVAIGRLTRQKGFDILIDAMPSILKRVPGARLTVLGQGHLQRQLMEQTQRLGLTEAVRFLGFQKNPWAYLRYADLFVLPSRYEGTPNVLLEALALGKSVVAADCPGAMREIQDCDQRLILVPPENVSALAEAVAGACRPASTSTGPMNPSPSCLKMFDVKQVVGEYSRLLAS